MLTNTRFLQKSLDFWLYTFVFIHLAVWTLAPSFVRFNLPMDAMEGTTWGHQLEWGYDKNPFMNGWLTELAVHLSHHSSWLIYLFSQFSIALCFIAMYQLGKKFLPPISAFVGVLLLECIQYYNLHAIDFNDNTLEVGFWALTILFFYNAARKKDLTNWMLAGLFAGLSMMTKYYTVVLLLPLFLFLILNPDARQNFRKRSTYVGLFVFIATIIPHIVWLFHHQFITIDYAFNRVSAPPKWWSHLFFPGVFTFQMAEAFLPAAILLIILVVREKVATSQHLNIKRFDNEFLFFAGLGPLLVTILLSAVSGIKLRAGWGQPLFSLSGLMILAWLQPQITPKRFYTYVACVYLVLFITVFGYCTALIRASGPSSANYPGKLIAAELTEEWHTQFHTKIKYIAGARWLAGNVAFYSKDQPAVYIDWNKKVSTWINESSLRKTGAIFVWDLSDQNVPYDEIKKRFPTITQPELFQFAWLRNKNMDPIQIEVSYLPPK